MSTTWKATYTVFIDGAVRICYQVITGVTTKSAAESRFESITGFSPSIITKLNRI